MWICGFTLQTTEHSGNNVNVITDFDYWQHNITSFQNTTAANIPETNGDVITLCYKLRQYSYKSSFIGIS